LRHGSSLPQTGVRGTAASRPGASGLVRAPLPLACDAIAVTRPFAHPHDREILRLAVPALGALAAEPLYALVDTAVVP
jgi:hypothetical protein